jgi:hypothetical protein
VHVSRKTWEIERFSFLSRDAYIDKSLIEPYRECRNHEPLGVNMTRFVKALAKFSSSGGCGKANEGRRRKAHYAVATGDFETWRIWFDKSAQMNAYDAKRMTWFHAGYNILHIEAVNMLVGKADMNAMGEKRMPLTFAVVGTWR